MVVVVVLLTKISRTMGLGVEVVVEECGGGNLGAALKWRVSKM